MNQFDDLLPHCTTHLLGIQNNSVVSTGTGFYYLFNETFTDRNGSFNPDGTAHLGIVTNRHVIEGMDEVKFFFNTKEDGVEKHESDSLRMHLNAETVIYHPDPAVDLCVILGHEIIQRLEERNKKLHTFAIHNRIRVDESYFNEVPTLQNLVMIGYPSSLWDSVNNLPLIRKGINATPLYENYEGHEEFAVDIATYRGSSGSPVFIYDNGVYIENNEVRYGARIIFVGVIRAAHLSTKVHTEDIITEEMLHIGIAIKASKVDVFEELVRDYYQR